MAFTNSRTTKRSARSTTVLVSFEDECCTFCGYPQQESNAIKRGGRKDVTETRRLWQSRDSSYVPTPLPHDGHLYSVSDKGQAFCVNAKTGETITCTRLSNLLPHYQYPLVFALTENV